MRTVVAVRCGLVLLAMSTLAACAEQPAPRQPGAPAVPSGLVELQPLPDEPQLAAPDDLIDSLEHPPVTTDMITALDRVRAAAGGSPDSGDPEITLDRTRIVVRWHGDVPDAVQAVVDAYTEGPFTMQVEQTPFRPGDLRAEADRLIRAHPGVVTGVGARPAGDGIDVMIADEVVEQAGGLDQALERNAVISAFPLFATAGSVTPA